MVILRKIKNKLKKGFTIRIFGLSVFVKVEKNAAKSDTAGINNRLPFSETIYNPRWRLKNYYALKEFGPGHKRWFTEQKYKYVIGQFPNLDKPILFNEKIHWLNLNYQDNRITRCCDKLELKKYVAEHIGEQYAVPTLKVYNKAADIDFSELPEKFAIKVNWGDGAEFSVVVKDKSKVNENDVKFKMNNAIQPWNNLYYSHFFWGYKNVPGRIFAEAYLEHEGSDLSDYKFHCFNGIPKIVLVCEERSNERMKKTFLDMDWNVLPCKRADGDVNPDVVKPNCYEEMIHIATKLAEPFPFVRVDFYYSNGRIYVGEMTFHPGCGLEVFIPDEWNRIVGDMLVLPEPRIIDED